MGMVLKILVTVFFTIIVSQASDTKIYEVKSGQVKYKIQGEMDLMGVKTKTMGTKSLIFDQFGTQMLIDEKKTAISQQGTKKTHSITYLKNGVVYLVDFNSRRIIRSENMLAMMSGNMTSRGKKIIQQMGGKKVGNDSVLGYRCELWELMGTTQCIHKGITLKAKVNIMGSIQTETATQADFRESIDQSAFKLPDFPITDQMGNTINKQQLNNMDSQSMQEMQELEKATKNFNGSDMFSQMKQKILSQESSMVFLKKCLKRANTKDDAQECASHLSSMGSNDEESFLADVWNQQTKNEALQDINYYLDNVVPCVKQANNIEALQGCMQ